MLLVAVTKKQRGSRMQGTPCDDTLCAWKQYHKDASFLPCGFVHFAEVKDGVTRHLELSCTGKGPD